MGEGKRFFSVEISAAMEQWIVSKRSTENTLYIVTTIFFRDAR